MGNQKMNFDEVYSEKWKHECNVTWTDRQTDRHMHTFVHTFVRTYIRACMHTWKLHIFCHVVIPVMPTWSPRVPWIFLFKTCRCLFFCFLTLQVWSFPFWLCQTVLLSWNFGELRRFDVFTVPLFIFSTVVKHHQVTTWGILYLTVTFQMNGLPRKNPEWFSTKRYHFLRGFWGLWKWWGCNVIQM